MSEVKTNKISPVGASGTVTLGDSGDTITIPSGVTFANSGTATGFGKILQVVGNTYTTPETTAVQLPSYFTTGLTQAITPSSTSSKILVMVCASLASSVTDHQYMTIFRDSTAFAVGTWATGSQNNVTAVVSSTGSGYGLPSTQSFQHIDTPSTTSSVTYTLKIAAYGGHAIYLNRSKDTTNTGDVVGASSSITLMEIAG
ncbi:MAG: hypothetical protein GY893_02065 [bacterium]|nr:hypothetical protein [bacterium]